MDCKRPHKYRALKLLAVVVGFLAMTSCTWVKDDTDDCPYGFWLQLHYAYNMLDVDAAPNYVTDAYVFVYDSDGNYVKRIYVTQDALKANDYRVRIEELTEGNYQFVVWSGIGNSQYAVSGDTKTINDFRLALAGTTGAICSCTSGRCAINISKSGCWQIPPPWGWQRRCLTLLRRTPRLPR